MGNIKAIFNRIKESNLTRSAIVYTMSTFFNSLTPFILLPILTRYLTTEEYGIISMFNATASFLIPFMGMSIGSAIVRKMADGNENESKAYIFNSLLITFCSSLLISVLFWGLSSYISTITSIAVSDLKFVLLYTFATCICNTVLNIFQIQEKVKTYAVFQNGGTLFNLVLSIIFVVGLGWGLAGRIYGLTFSKLVFAGIAFIYIVSYIGAQKEIKADYIKDEVLNFGLPMIPTEIKATILTYTDRLFVTNMISVSETGIYSVGNQFSMPILILAQAFNLAYVPWLFKNLNRNEELVKKKIVKLTYGYFGVILSIALCWSLISKSLLFWISGEDYRDAISYVLPLSLGYAFTGMHMMVVNYIYYVKKLRLYTFVTLSVIVSNVFLNYFFIINLGAIGAAYATLIANVISFVLTWILSSKVYKMPWNLRRIFN